MAAERGWNLDLARWPRFTAVVPRTFRLPFPSPVTALLTAGGSPGHATCGRHYSPAARAFSTTIARPHFPPSSPRDMEVFDIENFISEIEAHPAIWDSRTEVYSDREKRSQAWNEMCLKFIPNFAEKSVQEKNTAATQLQRRWKSFRDCFKREHTKQIKALKDSASSSRKPYKYYQNLSFLMNVTETKVEASPSVHEEKDLLDLLSVEKTKKKRKRNNESSEREKEFLQSFTETFAMTQSEVEEADRNFVLSLLPHFKQIPYEYKLDAQMEILMVLKKYKPFGRQHFEFFPETPSGQQHSVVYTQPKLSPPSSDDGQAMSDDSSINEHLYY